MRFISWETIFGIVAGFGLFGYAIFLSTDNTAIFWSVSSILMVLGGTFAATMISYQARYVLRTLKAMIGILIPTQVNPATLFKDVGRILKWSEEVRRHGPAVLDEKMEKYEKKMDVFTKYGMSLLTTGYKGDELRELLTEFSESLYERSQVQVGVLKTMASFAPSFGMIGTLVGLVIMLDNLKADVSQLGQGLALALITTLYGVLAANMFFKPAALKTDQKNNMNRFRNVLMLEGFVMLSERQDPLRMQDRLNSFLDPALHFDLMSEKKD
ncbi:MAG: MotA/TolQ/ExbB proton channel family protein [Gammaproteobacteria bacterium]|nr:MotA/TolQ/ExbB proton channel family protein [Gammaproteobacteria bacterium]